jgi:hypothetical protein
MNCLDEINFIVLKILHPFGSISHSNLLKSQSISKSNQSYKVNYEDTYLMILIVIVNDIMMVHQIEKKLSGV